MGTTADKLQALLNSKKQLKETFGLADDLPFSQYATNINVTPGTGISLYKCAEVGPAESGDIELPEPVFYAPLTEQKSTAETEQALTYNGNVQFTEVDGVKCAYFDGSSYILTPNESFLPSGTNTPRSVSCCMYALEPGWRYAVTYGDVWHSSSRQSEYLGLTDNGYPFYGQDPDLIDTSGSIVGEWVHVVGVCSGNQRKIYINGNLHATSDSTSITLASNIDLYIGSCQGSELFHGYLADVQIFDTALTDEQVARLYASNFEPLEPFTWNGYKAVLVDGYYTFEETLTKGLTYGNGFIPEIDKVYDGEAMVVAELNLEEQA